MKNLKNYAVKIWYILLLGGMFFFLTTYCTEEPFPEEVQNAPALKASRMLPKYQAGEAIHYQGTINNDIIEIAIPVNWNGYFIVYAHGYVDPTDPIELPDDVLIPSPPMTVKDLITLPNPQTGKSFAYAATSYSQNGFAVKEAITDILFLGNMIKAHYKPDKIFLGGVSEGGLVTLKTLERNQKIFDAGIIVCGPIGDFNRQLQYFGDFHVLFNYIYEDELNELGLNLGSPAYVPPVVMQAWSNGDLELPLLTVIGMHPWKLPALLHIAKVPVDGVPPGYYPLLAKDILRFNIMATNDMVKRVHGVPFNNVDSIYSGVLPYPINYTDLNERVMRISGDKQALHRVNKLYESSGSPNVPVVFMHTMGDHVTPIWHLNAFIDKADPLRTDLVYLTEPVPGHCNFTMQQILEGIGIMVALSE
ncbi:hypothetical protein E9993_04025 [Labilibacter sediminis]|nr:hypothetical protein E9993_04025 [Labilibacter sediminis]